MKTCRTKALHPDFSDCLVENPSCRHALQFGYSFLCKHPDHREFILSALPQIETAVNNGRELNAPPWM